MSSRALADVLCAAVGPHTYSPGGPGALMPSSAPVGSETDRGKAEVVHRVGLGSLPVRCRML